MAPLLTLSDGRVFAGGATSYWIGAQADVARGKMLIQVRIEGQPTVAAVDTGGHYVICNPDLRQLLESHLVDAVDSLEIEIRGHYFRGTLYQLSVEIEAALGDPILIPAIAFIPELDAGQVWNLPNFIGLTGVLDRIRFAVDPDESLFYFGPLGEG